MDLCRVLLFLGCLASVHGLEGKPVICRYVSASADATHYGRYTADDIPVDLCTHVIYRALSFPQWIKRGFVADENEKRKFGEFVTTIRRRSPSTKIILSIFGIEDGSERYSSTAEIPERRRAFVQTIVDLINEFGVDGLEIDWEWPGQRQFGGAFDDRQALTVLLGDLRRAFSLNGLRAQIYFFGAVYPSFIRESYQVSQICELVDYVLLFTFEMRDYGDNLLDVPSPMRNRTFESGSRAKTNVVYGTEGWIDFGCPPRKLILGIGLFGRSLTLANPSQTDLISLATGPGTKGILDPGYYTYYEVCSLLRQPGWTVRYDRDGQMPFAFRGNQWISYEDVQSIRHKVDFLEERKLGGALIHYIGFDDFQGICGPKNPLTTYIAQRLQSIRSNIGFAIEWS